MAGLASGEPSGRGRRQPVEANHRARVITHATPLRLSFQVQHPHGLRGRMLLLKAESKGCRIPLVPYVGGAASDGFRGAVAMK